MNGGISRRGGNELKVSRILRDDSNAQNTNNPCSMASATATIMTNENHVQAQNAMKDSNFLYPKRGDHAAAIISPASAPLRSSGGGVRLSLQGHAGYRHGHFSI